MGLSLGLTRTVGAMDCGAKNAKYGRVTALLTSTFCKKTCKSSTYALFQPSERTPAMSTRGISLGPTFVLPPVDSGGAVPALHSSDVRTMSGLAHIRVSSATVVK